VLTVTSVSWAGAFAGSANGQVAGTYNNGGAGCPATVVAATPETCHWWDHLRRAGFVSGTGGSNPFNALTGMIGVQTGNGAGGATFGTDAAGAGGFAGLIVCSANLPDKIAIAADTQMDDGTSTAGTVRAIVQGAPNPATANPAGPAYAETGTNTYLICRSL